ncbi:MAG: HesA/MoeB/ThiF family protein [Breznakibacter sp.]
MVNPDSERYSRHLLVDGFDRSHQKKLACASVFVAGCGGLGSAILTYLGAVGVGHLGFVDFDTVSESNLNRQVLYHPGQIGLPKAEKAAKRLGQISPDCRLTVFNRRMDAENINDMVNGFDIVMDATDNFAARYLLDDTCNQLQKPFVYATAEQWGGQLSVFHYRGAKGYRQLYPSQPLPAATPPGIMGPVAGLIGMYAAIESVKIITGLGNVLSGKLLCVDALRMDHQVFCLG